MSSANWKDITTWRALAVETSISELDDIYRAAKDGETEFSGVGKALDWEGEAAAAARTQRTILGEDIELLRTNLSVVITALTDAAGGIRRIEGMVEDVYSDADFNRLKISPVGVVLDPEGPSEEVRNLAPDSGWVMGRASIIHECEESIRATVRQAREVDDNLCADLSKIIDSKGEISSITGVNAGISQRFPQTDWSPLQVAAWWNALSTTEQEDLIRDYPEVIANLDGVAATVRDRVNRTRLTKVIRGIQSELDRLISERDALLANFEGDYSVQYQIDAIGGKIYDAERRLEPFQELEDSLNSKPGFPIHQLLVFDNSEPNLKAAVAVGDVDKATHLSVVIPGLRSNVRDTIQNDVLDVENLQSRSQRESTKRGDGGPVATIAWLGYDAPQSVDVGSVNKAHAGADKFVSFVEGLYYSHAIGDGVDPHITVHGYSYGSTTMGFALKEVEPGIVDDTIFFGSPGSGAEDVKEFNVKPGHVYAQGAVGDPVCGIGPQFTFGKDPMWMDGVTILDGQPGSGVQSLWKLVPPVGNLVEVYRGFADIHTSYLDDGSDSQLQQAQVAAGTLNR